MINNTTSPTSPSTAPSTTPKLSQLTQDTLAITKSVLEDKYSKQKLTRNNKAIRWSDKVKPKTVKDYDKIAVIGRGAFGEVRLVRDKQTGQVAAMKMLKKTEMMKKNQVQHVRTERNLMADSGENNINEWIVELYSSFQDNEYLYLVMEYLPAGDMMTWLIQREYFTEEETRFYIAELVMAVGSIHALGYVHRDLKVGLKILKSIVLISF